MEQVHFAGDRSSRRAAFDVDPILTTGGTPATTATVKAATRILEGRYMKQIHASVSHSLAIATVAGATLVLQACGTMSIGGTAGPPVPAPIYRVGDSWTYHGEEGFRLKVMWDETHEITAIGPDGITVTVATTGQGQNTVRTEKWQSPGVVQIGAVLGDETSRFDPALVRYQFPLTTGDSWQQRIRNLDQPPRPYGPILRTVNVGGFQSVTTPAGTFDAIMMRVILTLDDETAFRWPTQCTGLVRYAPTAAAASTIEYVCLSRDKGDRDFIQRPGPNPVLRLTSYKRGP